MDDREKIIDCAVIGAGVAGLSAALFLGRAGLNVVVFDSGPPRIMAVAQVREYLGFDGVPPAGMLAQARAEVIRYGVTIVHAKVEQVLPLEDGFFSVSANGQTIHARTVVLATGLKDILPAVTGVGDLWGDDLRVCPCFDGYEVLDRQFVVFGLPERLAHMAAWVSMWSSHVTVVSRHEFDAAEQNKFRLLNIHVVQDEVLGLNHSDGRLISVTTTNGQKIECDATWVAMAYQAASGLAASLCDVDEYGLAKTDAGGRSSRPGVFAIGNASVSGAWAHLAHAASSGTNVGPLVTNYLLDLKLAAMQAKERELLV
ncbi:NAD(P)/FAD-dependent oxidoreductase [Undibacterium sp. CY18W]|uniref:NAD(P)/FAD-dependent oxidoreductase n=1 Tax=Undibacterium hunanense TaxID=2762292 RepID=A0ABR6ZWY7_9BURK|nr:NAD(P)/FAD-dependent oxidoreductase [Undibacterium hunanense]MBC3920377.1 NAD(P)/FAD-dependent oxidoreductase [Undibacterium hunanense]